ARGARRGRPSEAEARASEAPPRRREPPRRRAAEPPEEPSSPARLRAGRPRSDQLVDQEDRPDEQVREVLEERRLVFLVDRVSDALEDPADEEGGEPHAPRGDGPGGDIDRGELDEHRQAQAHVEGEVDEDGRRDGHLGARDREAPDRDRREHGQGSEQDRRDPGGMAREVAAGAVEGAVVGEVRVDPLHVPPGPGERNGAIIGARIPGMRAMVLRETAAPEGGALTLELKPAPSPGPGEVAIAVDACGVCRTDLHIAAGEVAAPLPRVLGHQAAGHVAEVGPGVEALRPGDAVAVAWLASACGPCQFCRGGRENLCEEATFTGRDRDGGFADSLTAQADFVYRLPPNLAPIQAAPLLCAGVIGYRSLRLSGVEPGA